MRGKNEKTRNVQGMVCVDWGLGGGYCRFYEQERQEQWEGGVEVRGAGKFPISSSRFSVHHLASQQVLMAHDEEGSWLRELRAGPGPPANSMVVVGVIGGWRAHPAVLIRCRERRWHGNGQGTHVHWLNHAS
jgi:hypothetical protein